MIRIFQRSFCVMDLKKRFWKCSLALHIQCDQILNNVQLILLVWFCTMYYHSLFIFFFQKKTLDEKIAIFFPYRDCRISFYFPKKLLRNSSQRWSHVHPSKKCLQYFTTVFYQQFSLKLWIFHKFLKRFSLFHFFCGFLYTKKIT